MADILLIIVLIVIIIFLVVTVIHLYNNLVNLRNRVKNSYSQIEVQLKRRNDLIPNLVETVKGYAGHEKEVFENVTKARSNVINATNIDETSAANDQLTGALKSLFAVAENYPELKANTQYTALLDELAGTENRLAVARKDYNDNAKKFNTSIRKFPRSIIAGIFGFSKYDYFENDASANSVPEVSFE